MISHNWLSDYYAQQLHATAADFREQDLDIKSYEAIELSFEITAFNNRP